MAERMVTVSFTCPVELVDRMGVVVPGKRDRSEFIREAVERAVSELEGREALRRIRALEEKLDR